MLGETLGLTEGETLMLGLCDGLIDDETLGLIEGDSLGDSDGETEILGD